MKTVTSLAALAVSALLLTSSAAFAQRQQKKDCPKPTAVEDSKFHPGQVWKYKTREQEKDSRLTVLRVESRTKLGTIVHIAVSHVRLRNCLGGPEPDTIEHMPFTKEALERSVTSMVRAESEIPSMQGYDEWLRVCGGVYTIAVAEAVEVAEKTFRSGLRCDELVRRGRVPQSDVGSSEPDSPTLFLR